MLIDRRDRDDAGKDAEGEAACVNQSRPKAARVPGASYEELRGHDAGEGKQVGANEDGERRERARGERR